MSDIQQNFFAKPQFITWLRRDYWDALDASLILSDLLPSYSTVDDDYSLMDTGIISQEIWIKHSDIDFNAPEYYMTDAFEIFAEKKAELDEKVLLICHATKQPLHVVTKSPQDWVKWGIEKNFYIEWLPWAFRKGFFRELQREVENDTYLKTLYLFPSNEELNRVEAAVNNKSATVTERSANSYLNIIGALTILILEKKNERGERYSSIEDQASLIEQIHNNFGTEGGLSQSNLEKKFALGRKSISSK